MVTKPAKLGFWMSYAKNSTGTSPETSIWLPLRSAVRVNVTARVVL